MMQRKRRLEIRNSFNRIIKEFRNDKVSFPNQRDYDLAWFLTSQISKNYKISIKKK